MTRAKCFAGKSLICRKEAADAASVLRIFMEVSLALHRFGTWQ